MPMYEYRCLACNEVFEELQKFSDPVVERCSLCKRGPVRRLIGGSNFVLKGGGWYKDGYSSTKS